MPPFSIDRTCAAKGFFDRAAAAAAASCAMTSATLALQRAQRKSPFGGSCGGPAGCTIRSATVTPQPSGGAPLTVTASCCLKDGCVVSCGSLPPGAGGDVTDRSEAPRSMPLPAGVGC